MNIKEECPVCTGRNGGMGLGAIEDRESWSAGGKGWRECWECDGTGFIIIEVPDPNDIIKEIL